MATDLNLIYRQYQANFDGRTAILTSKFNKLDVFYIKFDILQLPHLLGLHKIYSQSPASMCASLNDGSITYEKIQRHRNFGMIKDRITLFPFILDIFLEEYSKSVIYVGQQDRNGSSMMLDIAFAHPYKNKYLTLGLRENIQSVYVPVTFFAAKSSKGQPFPRSKRAKIETLDMIQTNYQQMLFKNP